jgi:hypothetical protein
MARIRGFVPTFDRLGLRITPSDTTPAGLTPEDCYDVLIPEDSDTPGSNSSISDSITWNTNGNVSIDGTDQRDSTLPSVDWMLPLG